MSTPLHSIGGLRAAARAGRLSPRRMTAAMAVFGVGLGSAVVTTSPASAEVTVIEVTTTDDSGSGSLRAALVEANSTPSDDRITFSPTVTGTIMLTTGQLDAVAGSGSGNLTIEGPGRDDLTVDAGGQSRVLDVQSGGGATRATVGVSGLTLTGGASPRFLWGEGYGGGLRATGVDLVLDRLTIADSWASEYGGGGGVAVFGASLLVSSSRITGNTVGHASGQLGESLADGGGIFFDEGEAVGAVLVVRVSTISDNVASRFGGGIHSSGRSPVTVTDSTVSGNTASYTWNGSESGGVEGVGGGISASDLTVVDSRIIGNEAGKYGGGLAGDSVVVTGSTIADNVAGEEGGGIRVDGTYAEGELRVESSTVSGNRAEVGGGLRVVSEVPAEVRLSTIAANAAVTGGGLSSGADFALLGSIVGMNTGGDLAGDGRVNSTRSLVQEPSGVSFVDAGGSVIGEDPLLGPLADHGGPTDTLLPASNSSVIDRGDAFGQTTDQRGLPRPVDDPKVPDAADGSDIGALELSQPELSGLPQIRSTARPTIVGSVRVGETLHAEGGTWEPADASLSYQWLRDGVPIPGATGASYTLTPDDYDLNRFGQDLRKRVSVRVTATAQGHRSGTVESDFTSYVLPGRMRVSRAAQVTGKLRVGSTLRAWPRVAAISPRPTSVRIQWFLGDRRSPEAGGRRFELEPRMRGKRVKARFFYWPPQGYRMLEQVVTKRRPVR